MRAALNLVIVPLLAACAEAPPRAEQQGPADVPDVAEIVCQADGTTRVVTPRVRIQRDGIHVHVRVDLEEPVVLDGLWLDRRVVPGEADVVTLNPPGTIPVACWPVSELDSESFEPVRHDIAFEDPDRIHVSEELECLPGDDTAGWTVDFAPPGPDRSPPVTAAEAEAVLRRLQEGDIVTYAGYPEAPYDRIVVERAGRTIAVMSFYREGSSVDSDYGGVCEGEAVLPPGID